MRLILAAAAGAALGSAARVLVSVLAVQALGSGAPWGTLAANVSGAVLIGAWSVLTAPGARFQTSDLGRAFAGAGLFGGYTTFSVFSLEVVLIAQAGEVARAAAWAAGSLGLWLLGAAAGRVLGRALERRRA